MSIDPKTSLLDLYNDLANDATGDLAKITTSADTNDKEALERVVNTFFLREETTDQGVKFHFRAKTGFDKFWGWILKLWSREPPRDYNFDKNFTDIRNQFENLSPDISGNIYVKNETEAANLQKLQVVLNALSEHVAKKKHPGEISKISYKFIFVSSLPPSRPPPAIPFAAQAKQVIERFERQTLGPHQAQFKEYFRSIREKLIELSEQKDLPVGERHNKALADAESAIAQIDVLKEHFASQTRIGELQNLDASLQSLFDKLDELERQAKNVGLDRALSNKFQMAKINSDTRLMQEKLQGAQADIPSFEKELKGMQELTRRMEHWIDAADALCSITKARSLVSGSDSIDLEKQLPKAATDDLLDRICEQLERPLDPKVDEAGLIAQKEAICSRVRANRLITKAYTIEIESRLSEIDSFRKESDTIQGRMSNLRGRVPEEHKVAFEEQALLSELTKALVRLDDQTREPMVYNVDVSEPWQQFQTESQALLKEANRVLSKASDVLNELTKRPEEKVIDAFILRAKKLTDDLAFIPQNIARGLNIKGKIDELHQALQEHVGAAKQSMETPELWSAWKSKAESLTEQAQGLCTKCQFWIDYLQLSTASRNGYEAATGKALENCYIPGQPPLFGNERAEQLIERFVDPKYNPTQIQQLQAAFLQNVQNYEAALIANFKAEGPQSRMGRLFSIEFSEIAQKALDSLRMQVPKNVEELQKLANADTFKEWQSSAEERFDTLLQEAESRRGQVQQKAAKNAVQKQAEGILQNYQQALRMLPSFADKLKSVAAPSELSELEQQLSAINAEIDKRSAASKKVMERLQHLQTKVEQLGDIQDQVQMNLNRALTSLQAKFPTEAEEEVTFEDFGDFYLWVRDALVMQEGVVSEEQFGENVELHKALCDYLQTLISDFDSSLDHYLETQGVIHKLQKTRESLRGVKAVPNNVQQMVDNCVKLLDAQQASLQAKAQDLKAHRDFLDRVGSWLKNPNLQVSDKDVGEFAKLVAESRALAEIGAFLEKVTGKRLEGGEEIGSRRAAIAGREEWGEEEWAELVGETLKNDPILKFTAFKGKVNPDIDQITGETKEIYDLLTKYQNVGSRLLWAQELGGLPADVLEGLDPETTSLQQLNAHFAAVDQKINARKAAPQKAPAAVGREGLLEQIRLSKQLRKAGALGVTEPPPAKKAETLQDRFVAMTKRDEPALTPEQQAAEEEKKKKEQAEWGE